MYNNVIEGNALESTDDGGRDSSVGKSSASQAGDLGFKSQ